MWEGNSVYNDNFAESRLCMAPNVSVFQSYLQKKWAGGENELGPIVARKPQVSEEKIYEDWKYEYEAGARKESSGDNICLVFYLFNLGHTKIKEEIFEDSNLLEKMAAAVFDE